MVHLEDASVALGAMMASVWLCLVAPLANTHATVALALNRSLYADDWLLAGVLRSWARLVTSGRTAARLINQRALSRLQVFQVFVSDFTRLSLLPFDMLVGERILRRSLVLIRGSCAGLSLIAHHWDRLFSCRGVCGHVPFFVFWNVSRVCPDSPDDGYQEISWSEGE